MNTDQRQRSARLSVAPMMDCTDRYDRAFLRCITKRTGLYTEMIVADAVIHGNRRRLLEFDEVEHPVALQIGGSDPRTLADAARVGEDFGYDEINLNVGCPSSRVRSGRFGACLMAEPGLVAECVRAMRDAVSVPVTVKCRIGVDDMDDEETLPAFISEVSPAGCATFIVHARKAFLQGLSPRENREIPPLRHDVVHDVKRRFPSLQIVINGGISASRLDRTREESDGQRSERASANGAIRIGSFGVSGNTNFDRQTVLPYQPTPDPGAEGDGQGGTAPPMGVSKLTYGAQADYQVDLIGSTTFRPTVSVDASRFQSEDTNGEFVTAPMRLRVGAAVGTDLYAFLPGFGPFERIRHKVSPRFQFDYSPAVEASDSLLSIPGFPVSNSQVENRLRITLNQTFEAKLREEVELDPEAEALLEGRSLEDDSLEVTDPESLSADSLVAAADSGVVAADSGAVAPEEDARGIVQAEPRQPESDTGDPGAPRRAQPRRNVVMLGINSSPLMFDFARENESSLTTDRWSHRINSDLLRGLSLNMSLDLFEGSGETRTFAPILSSLTGSFTFSSASGLGGLLGLGGGGSGRGADPGNRLRNAADSRFRLQSFDENPDPMDPGMRAGGPWTLSLTYSMQRGRENESARDRQSLNAVLSLNPTPNWSLAWRTSYNLTEGKFGEHMITLDRGLHRWMATFMFARSPNGNFIFQMSVNLRDAPDLKFDYDQQTQDR